MYVSPDNARRKDPRFCETYPELCNDAKYDEYMVVDYICHSQQEKQCSSSLECYNLLTFNCDSITKTCGFGCYDDNDCFAKDEFCDKTNYACYPVSIFTCENGQYFSAVEQKCVAKCSQDSVCPYLTAHCNEVTGVCVSNCTTNEDCTGFKWSGGSVCNSNGFCE